jgi:DNA-binding MarR family transcriptional regulator
MKARPARTKVTANTSAKRAAPSPEAILDALYSRPGFLIRRANQIAAAVHGEECARWGLTQAQHGALLVAHCCPGIDQTGIGQALGFDRATTGQVLRGLETRGLVERAVSGGDGRRRIIVPTREGESVLRGASPALDRAQNKLLAPLSAAERRQLSALLGRLCDAFNAGSRAPVVRPEVRPKVHAEARPRQRRKKSAQERN